MGGPDPRIRQHARCAGRGRGGVDIRQRRTGEGVQVSGEASTGSTMSDKAVAASDEFHPSGEFFHAASEEGLPRSTPRETCGDHEPFFPWGALLGGAERLTLTVARASA